MEYFNYNGKLYAAGSAVLSVDSRGLRYGDGLFETIKGVNHDLKFINEHLDRLWNGMMLLQFRIPKLFSRDSLCQQIVDLLKKNNHHKIVRIRLTVFRGDGGLYDEIDHAPNYLIQTWGLPDEMGGWNSNGLVLGIYTDIKKSCDLLSTLKHNNFLPYAMAAIHAKKNKWNDAVLQNTDGGICDTTIANIFLIKDETVYTPALNEGCIAGIMRKQILQQLSANNIHIIEDKITITQLLEADEVFLSNSIHNMRWVQSIGDKKYNNIITQKIYSILQSTIF